MKLPEQIKGKNRLRDLKICDLYVAGLSVNEIFETFRNRSHPLTLRRIHQIISNNSEFITPRVGWTKAKRLHRLQRIADKQSDTLSSRRDVLDVMEQIRVEIEGKSPNVHIDNSKHITQIFLSDKLKSARERHERLLNAANAG